MVKRFESNFLSMERSSLWLTYSRDRRPLKLFKMQRGQYQILARGANTPGLPFIDCGIVEPLMAKLNSGPLNKFKVTMDTAITFN